MKMCPPNIAHFQDSNIDIREVVRESLRCTACVGIDKRIDPATESRGAGDMLAADKANLSGRSNTKAGNDKARIGRRLLGDFSPNHVSTRAQRTRGR